MTSTNLRENIYSHYGHDFQNSGEVFDAASSEKWGKAYDWYLRRWLPLDKTAVIGELACGNGKLLHFFKQRGYTGLSAVDISPDQVALARQVIPDVAYASALHWLKERENTFDLLISLDLIEHFNREESLEFISLVKRALKPGGRLIFQTPNADSPFGLQLRYGDPTHEWAFNINQMERLLSREKLAQIEPREMGPIPIGYSFKSTLRWVIWRMIRALLQLWNVAETGASLPALTRVFLVSAVKPK